VPATCCCTIHPLAQKSSNCFSGLIIVHDRPQTSTTPVMTPIRVCQIMNKQTQKTTRSTCYKTTLRPLSLPISEQLTSHPLPSNSTIQAKNLSVMCELSGYEHSCGHKAEQRITLCFMGRLREECCRSLTAVYRPTLAICPACFREALRKRTEEQDAAGKKDTAKG